MGCKLENFTLDSVCKAEELNRDSFNDLEHTGRKAMYSQGIYGQGKVAAVLDTGVSPHEELEDRLLPGKNCIEGYGNTKWTDDNMHGTHVAGTIAGKKCGIAPQAKILPVKVLRADGSGEWKDVVTGLDYARKWVGPKGETVNVISMSLSGGKSDITATEEANLKAAIDKCVDAGILVVVSAGNSYKEEKRVPACFDNVVTVGSVDWDRKIAEYSTFGNHVDLVQIGTKVISAYYEGEYAQLSGTSMSTPKISGMALLLACAHDVRYKEKITERKLYEALKVSTKDLGIKGIDKYYGAGFCTFQPLNLTIEIEDGSKVIKFNGENVVVDVPSRIEDGRFLFELRGLAEQTGAAIEWVPQNEYHKTMAKFIY